MRATISHGNDSKPLPSADGEGLGSAEGSGEPGGSPSCPGLEASLEGCFSGADLASFSPLPAPASSCPTVTRGSDIHSTYHKSLSLMERSDRQFI